MSSIFDLLMDQLGGDMVGQISRAVGTREEETQQALPELLGVLPGRWERIPVILREDRFGRTEARP